MSGLGPGLSYTIHLNVAEELNKKPTSTYQPNLLVRPNGRSLARQETETCPWLFGFQLPYPYSKVSGLSVLKIPIYDNFFLQGAST